MMPAFAQYIHLAARVKPDDAPHAAPAKAKLTKAMKLEYVRRWQLSGMGKKEFAREHGIAKNSLLHWTQGRSLEEAGKVRPHSQETKDKALALHAEGKSRRAIGSELGLSDTTVRDWITNNKRKGLE